MSRLELETVKRECLDKTDQNLGWHKYGCIRINPQNSLPHEVHKLIYAYNLLNQGHQIGTEIKLKENRIVDLVDFTTGKFYEFECGKATKEGSEVVTVRIK